MQPRTLLVFTAFLEILTGLGLLLAPALIIRILLGADIQDPVVFTITRVGGSAILSIGIVCWMARNAPQSTAVKALTSGLFVYNLAVFTVLALSGVNYKTTAALIAALFAHCCIGYFLYLFFKKNSGGPFEPP